MCQNLRSGCLAVRAMGAAASLTVPDPSITSLPSTKDGFTLLAKHPINTFLASRNVTLATVKYAAPPPGLENAIIADLLHAEETIFNHWAFR